MNNAVTPFVIRMDALLFDQLQDRIATRIRNVRNIPIQRSLFDQFLELARPLVAAYGPGLPLVSAFLRVHL